MPDPVTPEYTPLPDGIGPSAIAPAFTDSTCGAPPKALPDSTTKTGAPLFASGQSFAPSRLRLSECET